MDAPPSQTRPSGGDGETSGPRGCRRDVDAVVRDLDGVTAGDVYEASDVDVSTSTVAETHTRSVLELVGVDCRVCAGLIEAAVERLEAVSNATVSSGHGTLRVDYDPESVGQAELRAELSDLGYPVATVDEAYANRQASHWAEARFAAGILAGSMVLSSYLAVIYPTRFDAWFYGPEVVALLERALTSVVATHFYLNIAVLTGFVLLFTGGPILEDAAVAVRELSPNRALAVAASALALYLYSSLAAFWPVFDAGVYYDVVVGLIVGATVIRRSGAEAPRDDGRVEAVFEGSEADARTMLAWWERRPVQAEVTDVVVEEGDPEGDLDGFEKR